MTARPLNALADDPKGLAVAVASAIADRFGSSPKARSAATHLVSAWLADFADHPDDLDRAIDCLGHTIDCLAPADLPDASPEKEIRSSSPANDDPGFVFNESESAWESGTRQTRVGDLLAVLERCDPTDLVVIDDGRDDWAHVGAVGVPDPHRDRWNAVSVMAAGPVAWQHDL